MLSFSFIAPTLPPPPCFPALSYTLQYELERFCFPMGTATSLCTALTPCALPAPHAAATSGRPSRRTLRGATACPQSPAGRSGPPTWSPTGIDPVPRSASAQRLASGCGAQVAAEDDRGDVPAAAAAGPIRAVDACVGTRAPRAAAAATSTDVTRGRLGAAPASAAAAAAVSWGTLATAGSAAAKRASGRRRGGSAASCRGTGDRTGCAVSAAAADARRTSSRFATAGTPAADPTVARLTAAGRGWCDCGHRASPPSHECSAEFSVPAVRGRDAGPGGRP